MQLLLKSRTIGYIYERLYIVALHTYILQKQMDEQKKIIDEQKEQLAVKDNRSELLKSFAEHIQTHESNSYFYIATSKVYAKKIILNWV